MNNQNLEDGIIFSSNALQEISDTDLSSPLWTVEDVAGFLKLQPETVRAMARRGELPGIKLGKVWRFQKNAIHEMLANIG